MLANAKPNEIRITRVYNAPAKLVWEAWTDPAKVAKWWGPRGFTITTHSKDLRVGGHWAYTMHGPDGTNYENKTIYHEVEEGSRLVYDHGGSDDRPPLFRVTVEFRESGGQTEMDMRCALASPEAATEMKKFIKQAGGNATWDRLAEYLSETREGKDRFFINRTFEAPIATLFELWTNPAHIARWLPPTGMSMQFRHADIRPGGSSFYEMGDGKSLRMFGRAEYLSIEPTSRIVYTQQFCEEDGKISRHPFLPTWPETMLTVVTFAEESAGSTRVTISWEPYGPASAAEREAFLQQRGGMTMGWTGSFDKLEEVLSAY